MERREDKRRSRRLPVRFWERGSEIRHVGFTTNISSTGMYIATKRPIGKGTRIRAEVGPEGKAFICEAEVAHALQVTPALQTVRQPGMGIRFLPIEELVGELIPELGAAASGRGETPADAGVFRMLFPTRQRLVEAYERDIATGGLFIPTREPAAVGETVPVELGIANHPSFNVRFTARVVHRFEPTADPGSPQINLMAGMGVELAEADVERIRSKLIG